MPGKKSGRKKVYVSSAFGGKSENIDLAFKYLAHASIQRGASTYASHVIYPKFCNDFIPEQRALGMEMGLDFLAECDEYWAYFPSDFTTWSNGMIVEREYAISLGMPIKLFYTDQNGEIYGPYDYTPDN